jgi:hypothetical protein
MEATVVYRFHIALRGIDPEIWRRVKLIAGSSLADREVNAPVWVRVPVI